MSEQNGITQKQADRIIELLTFVAEIIREEHMLKYHRSPWWRRILRFGRREPTGAEVART